jgi:hypothetical protein
LQQIAVGWKQLLLLSKDLSSGRWMCTDGEGEIGREGETLRDGETEKENIGEPCGE